MVKLRLEGGSRLDKVLICLSLVNLLRERYEGG